MTSFFAESELKEISKESPFSQELPEKKRIKRGPYEQVVNSRKDVTNLKVTDGRTMTQKMLNQIKEAIVTQFEVNLGLETIRQKGNSHYQYVYI